MLKTFLFLIAAAGAVPANSAPLEEKAATQPADDVRVEAPAFPEADNVAAAKNWIASEKAYDIELQRQQAQATQEKSTSDF